MRSGILLDTGPIVAFLYGRERDHEWAVEQFSTLDPPFISCEPVLTEACFLVARNGQPPARVLELLTRSVVRIGLEVQEELRAVRMLVERYASVPMSLADACLVRLAELTGLPICTLDSDFAIYRAHGRRPLTLISPGAHHLHEP
ncbi:MAG TPA: PIN domain-containing protein [Stellaceae bacterium]|nr:PIN domain-containing protein [Stellaceae bacterium]